MTKKVLQTFVGLFILCAPCFGFAQESTELPPGIGDRYRIGSNFIFVLPTSLTGISNSKIELMNQTVEIAGWVNEGKYKGFALIEIFDGEEVSKPQYATSVTNLKNESANIIRVYTAPRSDQENEIEKEEKEKKKKVIHQENEQPSDIAPNEGNTLRVYRLEPSIRWETAGATLTSKDSFIILSEKSRSGKNLIRIVNEDSKYYREIWELSNPSLEQILRHTTSEEIQLEIGSQVDSEKLPKTSPPLATISTNIMGIMRGEFTYDGKKFAEFVDLSEQFQSEIELQQGGSCHVFAASALFEAYCKRNFGLSIDLSESYLFYRHLRETFGQSSVILSVKPIDPSDRSQRKYFTSRDGGTAQDTLVRLQNGEGCTESAFSFDREFVEKLEALRTVVNQKAEEHQSLPEDLEILELVKIEKEMGDFICEEIDGSMQCYFSGIKKEENGFIKKAPETSDLGKCIRSKNGFEIKEETFSSNSQVKKFQNLALTLLNEGNPFLCVSNYNYGETGGRGRHVAAIVGYEPTWEKKKYEEQANVDFLIRDSNRSRVQAFNVPICERVIWLTPRG